MYNDLLKKTDEDVIFIVEDNEIYARTLHNVLQTRFPNVKEIKIFRIGELCLMELYLNPCIVIMDYFLNSKYKNARNGIEIIKRIKDEKPETNIIVLSAQEKFDVVIDAIKLYNCDYVQKNEESYNKIELLIKEIFDKKNLGFKY